MRGGGRGPAQALRRQRGARRLRPDRRRAARCAGCSARTAPARPPRCGSWPPCCAPDGGQAEVAGFDVAREAADVRHRIGLARPARRRRRDPQRPAEPGDCSAGSTTSAPAPAAAAPTSCWSGSGSPTRPSRPVSTYSGGMRRRLDLAASLILAPPRAVPRRAHHRPRPARPQRGVGVRSARWSRDGTTVLLTTQYLDEADQLADRISVIDARPGDRRGHARPAQGQARRRPDRRRGPRRRTTSPAAAAILARVAGADRRSTPTAAPASASRARPGRRAHRACSGAGRRRHRGRGHRACAAPPWTRCSCTSPAHRRAGHDRRPRRRHDRR